MGREIVGSDEVEVPGLAAEFEANSVGGNTAGREGGGGVGGSGVGARNVGGVTGAVVVVMPEGRLTGRGGRTGAGRGGMGGGRENDPAMGKGVGVEPGKSMDVDKVEEVADDAVDREAVVAGDSEVVGVVEGGIEAMGESVDDVEGVEEGAGDRAGADEVVADADVEAAEAVVMSRSSEGISRRQNRIEPYPGKQRRSPSLLNGHSRIAHVAQSHPQPAPSPMSLVAVRKCNVCRRAWLTSACPVTMSASSCMTSVPRVRASAVMRKLRWAGRWRSAIKSPLTDHTTKQKPHPHTISPTR